MSNKWFNFKGKVIRDTGDYWRLIATDGSDAIIDVAENDIKLGAVVLNERGCPEEQIQLRADADIIVVRAPYLEELGGICSGCR